MPDSSTSPTSANHPFSFDRDTFFVEVAGPHRHRRATVYEIQELLHPSIPSTAHTASSASSSSRSLERSHQKDPAGHWYEAQCIHYGLRPSKTKSVAKTRLLDALNERTLKVPEAVRNIEERLRKGWHRREREKLVDERGEKGKKGVDEKKKKKEKKEEKEKKCGEKTSRKRKLADEHPTDEAKPTSKRKKATVKKEATSDSVNYSTTASNHTAIPPLLAEYERMFGHSSIPHPSSPPQKPRSAQTARRAVSSTARAKSKTTKTAAPSRKKMSGDDSTTNHLAENSSCYSHAWLDAFHPETSSPPRTLQTARCSRGGPSRRGRGSTHAVSSSAATDVPTGVPAGASADNSPQRAPRGRHYARRSVPFTGRARGSTASRARNSDGNGNSNRNPSSPDARSERPKQTARRSRAIRPGGGSRRGRAPPLSPMEVFYDGYDRRYGYDEHDGYDETDRHDGYIEYHGEGFSSEASSGYERYLSEDYGSEASMGNVAEGCW